MKKTIINLLAAATLFSAMPVNLSAVSDQKAALFVVCGIFPAIFGSAALLSSIDSKRARKLLSEDPSYLKAKVEEKKYYEGLERNNTEFSPKEAFHFMYRKHLTPQQRELEEMASRADFQYKLTFPAFLMMSLGSLIVLVGRSLITSPATK